MAEENKDLRPADLASGQRAAPMPGRPKALLIGATGPTGRATLAKAASEGWRLTALARRPESLSDFQPAHDVAPGDVLDTASLKSALRGVEVVLCLLGTKLTLGPVTLLSDGTRNIVAAMRDSGARRLICVTGVGAGDSRGHGGFVYDWIFLPTLLGRIYADKDRQETIVRNSDLDWLIVRPGKLTNGPETGVYRELTDLTNKSLASIARKDVAHFLVREALQGKYSRQAVNLSY